VLNVLPADVLVTRGCNFVIAVSVSSTIQYEFAGNRPDTPTEKMKTPSVRQTILRAKDVTDRNMNAIGTRAADFIIEPDVSRYDMSDFKRTPEIAAVGQSTAAAAIPELREILAKMDRQLFASGG
jgi:predicted acylesterase/phospholipase RssA